MFLPRFSEDDCEKVERFEDEEYNTALDDVMRNIDDLIGPEPADDYPDSRDASAWDRRTSPVVSPMAGPGEGARQFASQSRASLPPLPPISASSPPILTSPPPISTSPPPRSPSPPPRSPSLPLIPLGTEKKSIMGIWWERLKAWFKRKFENPRPKLSDRLVPERDDRVKWYEHFSESLDPTKARK